MALSHRGDRRARLCPTTINTYMRQLGGLLNVAVAEGLIARNPARSLKLPDSTRPIDRRRPFSPAQLQAIFDAPLYQGCQNDDFGYARRGSAHPKRGRFWVPLLSLYGGLRLNEAAQLDVADIQSLEGIDCFVVTPAGEGDKRVKTGLSERVVPIHSELKRLGLMAYVAARRAKGEGKLFPELPRSKYSGRYSSPFSKWFRQFLIHSGAEAPKTSFHSFRHNFRDALRRGGVDAELALALGGWTPAGGAGRLTAAMAYGSGYAEPRLAWAIEQVSYPTLDLSPLLPKRAGVHFDAVALNPIR